MTFGRNVGEKIADISFGYLIWLAEEKDEFKQIWRRYSSHPKVQQKRFAGFYDEQGAAMTKAYRPKTKEDGIPAGTIVYEYNGNHFGILGDDQGNQAPRRSGNEFGINCRSLRSSEDNSKRSAIR